MCAYSPGNQDISGQLMAQGISRFGDELQKGFNAYQQNKMLTAQSTAKFEGALRANPEILQLFTDPNTPTPTDATKAFEKLQKDGAVGLKDAAILAQFADSYTDNKRQMQENQMRQAQMQHAQMQAAQAQMAMEQEKAQVAKAAELQALGQFTQGVGRDVLRPEVQAQMQRQAADPIQQFAIQTQQATGRAPAPADVRQFMETRMQMQAKEGAAPLKVATVYDTDAAGNPVRISVDASTGKPIGNPSPITQPKYVLSPEEQARAKSLEKDAELESTRSTKFLTDLATKGEEARATLADVKAITDLYKTGAKTAFGQAFFTNARGALQATGLFEDKDLANQQVLETKLRERGASAVKSLNEGQGTVSEWERKMFMAAVANPNMTKEANILLMDSLAGLAERTLKLDDERIRLEEAGLPQATIRRQLEKMRKEIPIPSLAILARTPIGESGAKSNKVGRFVIEEVKE